MNIREMSIEIQQATQNIAAATRRKLMPDECDWLLNKNQERFIQSKVKPKKDGSGGFQVDQMDTDSIRTLLVSGKALPSQLSDEDEYTVQLPADYSYLISDDSKTMALCTGTRPSLLTVTDNILALPLVTTKSAARFYATIALSLTPTLTVSLADMLTLYGSTFTGTASKDEKYLVRDAMLWYFRNVLKLTVYWESYRSVYKPNSFLFIGYTAGTITIDGQSAVNGTLTTITYTRYDTTDGNWKPNRLTASDKISTMQVTPWTRSSYITPISELAGKELRVYGDASFIVTGVKVSYVKKPRRLSLALSQDCELPEEFHQAICDLTVEYFKAMTTDPSWEMKLKDNMSRSPNS